MELFALFKLFGLGVGLDNVRQGGRVLQCAGGKRTPLDKFHSCETEREREREGWNEINYCLQYMGRFKLVTRLKDQNGPLGKPKLRPISTTLF